MAEQIFPTKGNLIACKKNLTLAKLGFDLLDRKRSYAGLFQKCCIYS